MGLFAKAASLRDRTVSADTPQGMPGGGLLRRSEPGLHVPAILETPEALEEPPQPAPPEELAPPEPAAATREEPVASALEEEAEEASGPIVEWDTDEQEPAAARENAAPVEDFADRLAALIAQIMDTRAGIEAPGTLFALLGLRLGVERGAILVPDGRGVLSPWAASELDKTTLRRLRLTGEEVAAIAAGTAEGPALTPYLRLFSSRDASSIERLHLWPCPGPKAPVALVVATDMEGALGSSEVFRSFLPGILQALGQVLHERREKELGPMRSSLPRPVAAAPDKAIDEALERLRGSSAHASLLRVSLARIVEAVAVNAPALDRFRLAEDIGTVLGRLARDTADVTLGSSPHELLLLVHGVKNLDAELVLHSLLASLRAYLPSLPAIEPQALAPRVRRFPEEGATAAELIAATA